MMQQMAETNDGNHSGESDGEPWFFSENFGRATAASQYFLQVWFDDVNDEDNDDNNDNDCDGFWSTWSSLAAYNDDYGDHHDGYEGNDDDVDGDDHHDGGLQWYSIDQLAGYLGIPVIGWNADNSGLERRVSLAHCLQDHQHLSSSAFISMALNILV